jgi:O-acetylhomoserine/O-acetylserine sulfhydrylase-like pyridoxal-dependent enzyme
MDDEDDLPDNIRGIDYGGKIYTRSEWIAKRTTDRLQERVAALESEVAALKAPEEKR